MENELRSMGLGRRSGQKPSGGGVSAASPGKRRNGDREFYSFMQELDQERTAILHDIESEDKLRKWYYEQLEVFTKKIENLPLTETYNLQADMNRRQLEYEIQKLRESLQENLGSSESIATRHEARLHKIHMIEREMLRLQQRHSQLQDQEGPSSGACEEIEVERAVAFVEACTNTPTAGEAFVPKPGQENSAFTSDRVVSTAGDGTRVVSIATQTSDVVIPDFDALPDIPVPHSTNMSALFHGAWPIPKGPAVLSDGSFANLGQQETASVMSFNSSNSHGSVQSSPSPPKKPSNQHLGTKYPCFVAPQVEMVYSLLSMLGTHDKDDMSRTLLAMSSSQDSCIAMRQSGCMPLLIQLLHGSDKESGLLGNTRGSKPARARAAAALHNIVHSHPDDKRGRREARVLRLLEQIRAHCDQLRDLFDAEALEDKANKSSDIDHHPGPAIAALMKLSFDEEHRHAICTLGGLQAIAELLEVDQMIHDNTTEQYNITMRRYACMALTNLTFGDGTNKALLCSMKTCMEALVAQLHSPNEDLCQVAASVLRNLSWRADLASKKTLREVGAVTTLTTAAMVVKKESTLKSILSALWNLSAHCSENKADICAVDDALVFLVNTLTYKSPSKTLAIIENGGGILRNVSSHIAIREEYRRVLRQHGCLQILLKHLRSPSLTIVSNACGTLWNLSARCPEDQQALWDMGAVSMLKNLLHSKHKMISMGSAAALKNLLAARPSMGAMDPMDKHKTNMPSLHARKQRALEAEIDQSLSETCENVDSPRDSPVDLISKKEEQDPKRFLFGMDNGGMFAPHGEGEPRRSLLRGQFFPRSGSGDSSPLIENRLRSPQRVARSGSQDSVGSVHSDISHDRSRVQNMLAKSSKLLHERQGGSLDRRKDGHHSLQGYTSGSRSLDSAAEIYRARHGSPANSRIMQVMKEVALHAGLESEYNRNPGNQGEKGQLRDPQSRRFHMGFQPPPHAMKGIYGANEPGHGYKNEGGGSRLSKGENSGSEDEPINYSMKYDPDSSDMVEMPDKNGPPRNNQNFHPALNNRPVPKVGNYVGSTFTVQQDMPNMVRNNFPAPKNVQAERNYFNDKTPQPANTKKLNALHETDFATDDQPTDYSRLYAEHSDEAFTSEQSGSYPPHFRDCADCKLEEARRTNDMLEQMMGDDDCVRTFYTEGTPLNYMSTATSMTDLSAHPQRADATKAVMNQVPEDDAHGYATHFEKDTNNDGLSESVREVYNDTVQERTVVAPDSEAHSPSEKPKTYCEEGTPICFSRVSSLSSLHSADARDRHEGPGKHGCELQSIEEGETATYDLGAKKMDKAGKVDGKDNHNLSAVESPEKEHKTVTWDDNHQVQETPLMFSRCSSLGSLSSFDAHSVHSSVMSDYSRRPSGNVSPSDLPDSPSETMPPTPRSKSPSRNNGTKETGSVEMSSEENKTDTVKAAEAEERRDAQKRTAELQITTERTSREENIQMAEDLHSLPQDVPVTYATEDTPLNFSETTSLSGLSIRMEEPELEAAAVAEEVKTPKPSDWKSPLKLLEERENDNNSSLSEVSEGEEDILAQCISSAMPNNSSRKMKKSASDHAIKKKVGFFKIENLNQNKSRLPTKMINTGKPHPVSPGKLKKLNQLERKAAQPHPAIEGEPDSVKSYATEGTPLNFSRTGSLSDLSVCTDTSDRKPLDPLETLAHDESKSDNSSLMEDHDDFLTEVIQSAMPKGKSPRKPPTDRKTEGGENKGPGTKGFAPQHPTSVQNVHRDSETQSLLGGDTVTTFAVEGTPINFSTATSLSDLTMDSVEGIGRKLSDPEEGPTKSSSDMVPVSIVRNMASRLEDSVFLTDVAACDSPRVYGMEGTPMSFSRNDSLSSLGCIDDEHDTKPSQSDRELVPGRSKLPRRSNTRSQSKLPTPSKSMIPTSGIKSDLPSSICHREVVGQSSEESSQADTLHEKDQTKKFEVEGTPYCFSRNSSLSSLHTDDNLTRDNSGDGDQLKVPETEGQLRDQQAAFKMEGTPVCFSRNSSLSSLSIESSPNIPTQFEQDLLEECISSAMPKGKSSKPPKVPSLPSGLPKPSSASGPNREKMPLKSPLHIRAEFDADFDTPVNNRDRPRGGHSDAFYNSPVTPCQNQQSNHDRLTSWRKQPHKSCDEIFTSSPYHENKFSWRRSHSQDSENFLKQRKDVSNFEKAQIAPDLENDDGRHDSRFRRPFLPTMEAFQAGVLPMQDNRMLEEKQKEEKVSSRAMSSVASLQRESSSSVEKVDSEKSDKEDSDDYQHLDNVSVKDKARIEDIAKGRYPSGSVDTDDDLLASMEDALGEAESGSNETTFDNGGSGDTSCLNETVIHRPNLESNREKHVSETEEIVADDVLSLEDEKELEANANIVVSELFIEREMSSSALDEDMFIENETISLVSNGYNSDTASEVSISWSTSSKTNSEQTSDYTQSNNSQSENRLAVAKGPRIRKPSEKEPVDSTPKDDTPRVVRGRRKPLYPGSKASSVSSTRSSSVKSDSSSKIGKPSTNSTFKTPWNKTPPGASAKKLSPKSQSQATASVKGSPSKVYKGNQTSMAKTNTTNNARNTPAKISGPQSRLPTANSSQKDSPGSKGKGKPSPNERPKPPIKQGTFVKESSAVSQGKTKSDDSCNKSGSSPDPSSAVKLREKKSSNSSSTNRNSGGSSSESQRNSGGSSAEAWGKALGEYNFLVDKSQEQGYHAPYEQIQMQKNAKDCPEVLRRNSSNLTKTTTTTITVKISGGSPSGISRIATSNMRKTTSMSPSRCGSSSALNRTGSAGSLKKTGSRSDLKKSDSNASLKKGNVNSRPPTPSGRWTPTSLNFNGKNGQNSPGSTPTKRNESPSGGNVRKSAPGSIGKKQVTSKIASLWKKEDGGSSSGNSSDKSPPTDSKMPPKGSRVPTKKPALPVKPKISPTKASPKDSPPSEPAVPREGLSRSSTYDKISTAFDGAQPTDASTTGGTQKGCSWRKVPVVDSPANDSTNSDSSPPSRDSSTSRLNSNCKESLPFNSGTWTKTKPDTSPDTSVLPDADETFGGTVWRRYDSDQEENDDSEVWVKQNGSKLDTDTAASKDQEKADTSCVSNSSSVSDVSLSATANVHMTSNTSLISNTSMMNTSTASTTSAARRLVRNFASSSLKRATLSNPGPAGLKSPEHSTPVENGIDAKKAGCTKTDLAKKNIEGRTGTTASAIVAPFNYNPTPNAPATNPPLGDNEKTSLSPGKRSLIGSPTKHLTKTEMLLARRRSYLNSVKNEENSAGEGEEKKRTCLVTTV
ncbi:adenomatous polyposis coli protein-like isoform X2 [Liolophura sinensis]